MSKFDFINEEETLVPKIPTELLEKIISIHGIIGYVEEDGRIGLEHRNIFSQDVLNTLKQRVPGNIEGGELKLIFILNDGKTFSKDVDF